MTSVNSFFLAGTVILACKTHSRLLESIHGYINKIFDIHGRRIARHSYRTERINR